MWQMGAEENGCSCALVDIQVVGICWRLFYWKRDVVNKTLFSCVLVEAWGFVPQLKHLKRQERDCSLGHSYSTLFTI